MLEKIKQLDTNLFLYLNGKHNTFFDPIMYWASDKLFWFPFYAVIVFILIREYKKQSIPILISIGVLIVLCDQIASHLIKNTVKRLRPSHEPTLQKLIHLSNAGPGGEYGFVSSHSANAFGLATFLIIILPKKYTPLKWILGFWAFLVAYSRIYNGVHYPSDVIVAAVLGILLAYLVFLGYTKFIKMYINKSVLVIATLLFVSVGNAQTSGKSKNQNTILEKPKLVIGIVIDQMRYDYLYRFADKFGNGGFKRLLNQGFECRNTTYDYVPTYTGPGHAAIYTGTTPYYNGIIANDWYDRTTRKSVYVTEDTTVVAVGTTSKAGLMSPRRLMSTTMTDELRLSNNKQSKVIGVCLKDRGSILPSGHIPSAAYWFDNSTGNWITSNYYTQQLPQWVNQFNDKKICDIYLSKPWTTLFPIENYTVGLQNGSPYRNNYKGEDKNEFPHNLPAIKEKIGYELMRSTPFGNSFTVDFAIETLTQEKMGQSNYTDFLALSFSCTDYVGHQFGVNAIETQDTYARLDKDLERLFNHLDKTIGMQNVLIFLTADHGAAETPDQMKALNIPAGVFNSQNISQKLSDFIGESYGKANWVLHYNNQQFWLNNQLIEEKKINRYELIQKCLPFLQKMEGVQEVYNTTGIGEWKPSNKHTDKLINGISPLRSGEITMILQPNWFDAEYAVHGGTTHGSGYSYDTHVPLVWMGWKIKKGSTDKPINITDIASTVCDILHISFTNASVGNPMTEIIKK